MMSRVRANRVQLSPGGAVAVVIAFVLVLAVTLIGCGSSPVPRFFSLETGAARGSEAVGPGVASRPGPTLYVAPFDTLAPYDRQEIVYRPRDFELGMYAYRLWVMRPGPMVSDLVTRDLAARGVFGEVTTRPGEGDLTLRGQVVALEEIDEAVSPTTPTDAIDKAGPGAGGGLRAHLAMRFELLTRDGLRLWTHAFSVVRPVVREAPLSVVTTLGEILRDELETLAAGLAGVVQRLPSPEP